MWEDASEFQQEILADGTVTPEEYERAVFAALQCLDDAGIPHSQPVLDASGVRAPKWRFTIGPYPPGAQGIADECQSYYLTAITGVWSAQEAPTEAELQAVRESALRCARERGVAAADYETMIAELDNASEQDAAIVTECVRQAFTGELGQ